jgi:hypothetical protein
VEEREFGTVKCRAGTPGNRVLLKLLVVARCSGPLHFCVSNLSEKSNNFSV